MNVEIANTVAVLVHFWMRKGWQNDVLSIGPGQTWDRFGFTFGRTPPPSPALRACGSYMQRAACRAPATPRTRRCLARTLALPTWPLLPVPRKHAPHGCVTCAPWRTARTVRRVMDRGLRDMRAARSVLFSLVLEYYRRPSYSLLCRSVSPVELSDSPPFML